MTSTVQAEQICTLSSNNKRSMSPENYSGVDDIPFISLMKKQMTSQNDIEKKFAQLNKDQESTLCLHQMFSNMMDAAKYFTEGYDAEITKYVELQASQSKLSDKIKELEESQVSLASENKELQARQAETDSKNKKLQKTISALQLKITNTHAIFNENQIKAKDAQVKLESEIRSSMQTVQDLTKNNNALGGENAALKSESKDLLLKIRSLTEKNDNICLANSVYTQEKQIWQNDKLRLKKNNDRNVSQFLKLSQKQEAIDEQLQESKRMMAALEIEVRKICNNQLKECDEKIRDSEEKVRESEEKVRESERKVAELETEMHKINTVHDEKVCKQIEKMKKQQTDNEELISILKNKIGDERSSFDATMFPNSTLYEKLGLQNIDALSLGDAHDHIKYALYTLEVSLSKLHSKIIIYTLFAKVERPMLLKFVSSVHNLLFNNTFHFDNYVKEFIENYDRTKSIEHTDHPMEPCLDLLLIELQRKLDTLCK